MSVANPEYSKAKKINGPIIYVIILTALVSTGSSLAGGLMMYIQGLQSLEDNVEDNSRNEVLQLRKELLAIIDNNKHRNYNQYKFLQSDSWYNKTDMVDWQETMRAFQFATIRSMPMAYTSGCILLPHDSTNATIVYSSSWGDVYANGSREFVNGRFLPSMNNNSEHWGANHTTGRSTKMIIPTYFLNEITGVRERLLYSWDAQFYANFMHGWGSLDDPENIKASPEWVKGEYGSVLQRVRKITPWFSSDGGAHAFSGVDSLYKPPPPPHPFSSFKAIFVIAQYDFDYWNVIFADYVKTRPDTIVIAYDTVSFMLYASTTGQKLADATLCSNANDNTVEYTRADCVAYTNHMSRAIQDGVNAVTDSDDDFFVSMLSGDEYFIRKMHVVDTKVLLWIRPTSSVQGKVQEALVILIIFAAVVLVFDGMIALLELWYIALPLKQLSNAIAAIGRLQTEESRELLTPYLNKVVMVKEIRRLMEGMEVTTGRLTEYKSFIPEAVLEKAAARNSVIPPTREVCVLFTDIVESTTLWEECPEAMATALDTHNNIMRQFLSVYGGYEVKTIGDAFMITFQTVPDAIQYACAVQQALLEETWPAEILMNPYSSEIEVGDEMVFRGLRIRMGAHYGCIDIEVNPLTERSDYRGPTVNKSARLQTEALPGMVVVSSEVSACLKQLPSFSEQFEVHSFGIRHLKGLGDTMTFHVLGKSMCLRQYIFESAEIHFPRNDSATKMMPRGSQRKVGRSPSFPEGGSECGSESTSSSRSSLVVTPSLTILRFGMKKQDGSFAVLKFSASERIMASSLEASEIFCIVQANHQSLSDIAGMASGKIESVHGNSAHVSWNFTTLCTSHRMQAFRFCGILLRRRNTVSIGLCCSVMYHGVSGSVSRKFRTVVGRGVQYASLLADMSELLDSKPLVATSGGSPASLQGCVVPFDVWEADLGWGPYVLIEELNKSECCELRATWGDEETEERTFHAAIRESIASGTSTPLLRLREDSAQELSDKELSVIARLLNKPALATSKDCTTLHHFITGSGHCVSPFGDEFSPGKPVF